MPEERHRKKYTKAEITVELELEIRAGSIIESIELLPLDLSTSE